MATFIALLDMAGNGVAVNPANVIALTPVPASLLPAGVAAATYVTDADGVERLAVRGTVAATATALKAGSGSASGLIQAWGLVDGTGALLFCEPAAAVASIRNAAGDYTLTFAAGAPPGNAAVFVSSIEGTGLIVNTDGPLGATQDVKSFDATGAAADSGFAFQLLYPV